MEEQPRKVKVKNSEIASLRSQYPMGMKVFYETV